MNAAYSWPAISVLGRFGTRCRDLDDVDDDDTVGKGFAREGSKLVTISFFVSLPGQWI